MKCIHCGQEMDKEVSWCHFLMHFPFLMNIYKESFTKEEKK